jgi:alginate O-acetyltransferase complex protein AlgI
VLFNSLEFLLLFLPLTLVVALRLRGQPLLSWIAGTSVVFYAFAGHWWFIVPMLATTVIDYAIAHAIARSPVARRRAALLALSLTVNLGLLAYFKYAGLLTRTVAAALGSLGVAPDSRLIAWAQVTLPAGLSFYTFQTLSYVIDVWRGQARPEQNFIRFLGFISFFPHLVAGPLTRHHQLIPQLARIAEGGIASRWRAGILLFCIGLAKKTLIADRIGNLIDPLLGQTIELDMIRGWLALLGYAMQIYFDFSGYSDMAIGLGRLFGIELPKNFDSPYKAESPSDFWRRWHITLSLWLRDYLYIPLGGNRCSPARQKFNLMATMVLGGLWHGANWTFAAWGCWHGLLLVGHHAVPAWERRVSLFWRRNITFLLVTLGWVFFRSDTFEHAGQWFAALVGAHGLGRGWSPETGALLGLVLIGLAIVRGFPNSLEMDLERIGPLPQTGLAFATVAAIFLMNYRSKFLYFQF